MLSATSSTASSLILGLFSYGFNSESLFLIYSIQVLLSPFPCRQQMLHQVIVGIGTAVLHGAVFLHDLIDLVPALVYLFQIILAHGHIRRSDRRPCGRMLRQKTVFRDT